MNFIESLKSFFRNTEVIKNSLEIALRKMERLPSVIGGALGGLLLISVGYFFGFLPSRNIESPPTGGDIIAVANTYIVYTTFIFVLITIAITYASVVLARWFSITKEKEIKDTLENVCCLLHKDSEFAQKFVSKVMDDNSVRELIIGIVRERVNAEFKQQVGEDSEISSIQRDLADELCEETSMPQEDKPKMNNSEEGV